MTSSRHNPRTSFFAASPWPKLSLLRDRTPESSKQDIRIGVMRSTAGTGKSVILSHRPSVMTTTRPRANI